jgi:hypothetical protein
LFRRRKWADEGTNDWLIAEIYAVSVFITFRTGGALITAAMIVFIFGPPIIDIRCAVKQGKGQPIRADGPQTHLQEGRHADDGRADDPVRPS